MSKTISVEGRGSFSAAPDTIRLTMTLWSVNKEYEKAMADCTEKQERLNAAFLEAGFDADTLKTANFSVNTEYESRRQPSGEYSSEFVGYRCSHAICAEFGFDFARLGRALCAVASCLSEPELNISFILKDKKQAEEKMLAEAAENAEARARILAKASGVTLGELLRVDYRGTVPELRSSSQFYANDMLCAPMAKACAPDIRPEDITAELSASFVWEIK